MNKMLIKNIEWNPEQASSFWNKNGDSEKNQCTHITTNNRRESSNIPQCKDVRRKTNKIYNICKKEWWQQTLKSKRYRMKRNHAIEMAWSDNGIVVGFRRWTYLCENLIVRIYAEVWITHIDAIHIVQNTAAENSPI